MRKFFGSLSHIHNSLLSESVKLSNTMKPIKNKSNTVKPMKQIKYKETHKYCGVGRQLIKLLVKLIDL